MDVVIILLSKKDKGSVSLHLYLTAEERPSIPTLLNYLSKIVNKKKLQDMIQQVFSKLHCEQITSRKTQKVENVLKAASKTRTLKCLDPEKPGPRTFLALRNVDPEKPRP